MKYKVFITLLIFITVWFFMFLVWKIHTTSDTGNRYQIVNSDNSVILLDKRTGLTWRNVWNNEKEKIPANWQPMKYEGNDLNLPIGEYKIRQEYKKDYWQQFEEVTEE